jgi:8-oxo-dGTP diphosphatase
MRERHGYLRPSCPSCNYVYFKEPKVGVGVLITRSSEQGMRELLLIKRAVPPEQGKWCLPAGFVDGYEDPEQTAIREVAEETGLHVTLGELISVSHNPDVAISGKGASIFILYHARNYSGQLAAADDALEAEFFSINRLPEMAFDSTAIAISYIQNNSNKLT